MRVTSYNAGNASDAHVTKDYANLAARKPDVIGSQEVSDRAPIIAHVPGYDGVQLHKGHNSAHVALDIRDDLHYTDAQLVTLNKLTWVGRLVAGARKSGKSKPKPLLSVRLSEAAVGSTHIVPSWTRKRCFLARRLARKQVARCRAWFDRQGDHAVLVMDGNGPAGHKVFAPLREVATPYAKGKSHGIERDIVWVKGSAAVDVRALDGYSSDHPPVEADITWTTNPAPTPDPTPAPPQKENTVTETRAVDYSTARPSPALIKSKGYVGAGRYIALGSDSKHLTKAEAVGLRTGDLCVWLVAEGEANRATHGEAAGQSDARTAATAAAAIGYPTTAPLFAAVDFDADPAQVTPYLQGWKAVLGERAGVYGGIRVIDATARWMPWLWQTAAWSGGKLSPHAHIYQRVKMHNPIDGCDENVICRPIRVWGGVLAPPGVKRKPRPYNERMAIRFARRALHNAKTARRKLRFTNGLNWLLGRKSAS